MKVEIIIFCISRDHRINESRDSMVEIPSLLMAKVTVRTTERNKEIYMYYKFGQACVTNCASFVLLQIRQTLLQVGAASLLQIRASVVTNWGSYYKLGQLLLQNRAAITNWGKTYYKLGQLLQIKAVITNWAVTCVTHLTPITSSRKSRSIFFFLSPHCKTQFVLMSFRISLFTC